MSLYQIRLNVRYTTGRSASLLLAPAVETKAACGMTLHDPAIAARSGRSTESGRRPGAAWGVLWWRWKGPPERRLAEA